MSAIVRALESTPRYLALLKSQYWEPAQLRAYTECHLERTLKAAAKIPFYADRFGGLAKPEDLLQLPTLGRSDIAALNSSVRSIFPPDARLMAGRSSGSTGLPAEFIFDRARVRGRYAARIRALRAHGWNPLRRTVWHQVKRRAEDRCPDFIHHRFLPGFMALSTDLAAQIAQLITIDPLYLYMYPSSLEGMLRIVEENHRQPRSLRLIFTVGETVDDALRERTRRILGVEIADHYGTSEAFIAWQCPAGRYHVNAEHVLLEIVDDDGRQVAPGEMGRVLITTLENYLMPLVRYEIGDYAVAAEGGCACGRTLPLVQRIIGRKFQLFRAGQGRLFSPSLLIYSIWASGEVSELQLIQKAIDSFLVRYVSNRAISEESQSRIRSEFDRVLATRVGVSFERVSEIARMPGRKHFVAFSELNAA